MKYTLIPSALALSVFAALPGVTVAEGFVEDATVSLNMRNFYFNRNYINGTDPAANAEHGKAEAWTQSFILDARSGFTEGTVGFGVDVLGLSSFKLDGNRGADNTQLLPIHNDGQAADSFGRLAVAAKAKVSKTELKVGEWAAANPMMRSDDGRSLPQTFKGGQVTSNEIDGLTLTGARFNGNSQRNHANMERMSFGRVKGLSAESNAFNVAGAEYRFNNNATMVGAWHSRLENVYKQSYLQFTHSVPVGDWVLGTNLGYFNGSEEGAAKVGKLDNKVYQGNVSAKIGANTFTVGLQQVRGDSKFLRIDGASGGSLINDSFTASYDNPNERSWQLRHDYNFASAGVPGLTLMNRYISGSHVDSYALNKTNELTKVAKDGKEWGRETELGYTFQEGSLKDLSIRWRNMSVRRGGIAGGQDFDENRLIINYPLSLL